MSDIIINTKQYVSSHLRQPRGYGFWAFDLEKSGKLLNEQPVWISGTYTTAKKFALKHAVRMGADTIVVLP